jgi:hypothetical protein
MMLNDVVRELGVTRRRLYDVINVLEALEVRGCSCVCERCGRVRGVLGVRERGGERGR